MGQAVGLGVELAVGELPLGLLPHHLARHQRQGVGGGLGLAREGAVDQGLGLDARRRPPGQHLRPFRRRGERQVVQAPLRRRGHPGEQHLELGEQPLDGGRLEQALVVDHEGVDPRLPRLQDQGEVEDLGRELAVEAGARGAQGEAGELQLRVGEVLDLEHHREGGRVARRPVRLHGLEHGLERQVLVGVGAPRHLLDPGQQGAEAEIAGELRAQHQGVEEEADQPLDLPVGAVGDRHADQDVLLSGVAVEEGEEAGEQEHEGGHSRAVGERLEVGRQRRRVEAASCRRPRSRWPPSAAGRSAAAGGPGRRRAAGASSRAPPPGRRRRAARAARRRSRNTGWRAPAGATAGRPRTPCRGRRSRAPARPTTSRRR